MKALERIVVDMVVEYLAVDRDACRLDASLEKDLGADSLDLIDLAVAVGERFSLDITERELRQINTIQDIIDVLLNRGVTAAEDERQ